MEKKSTILALNALVTAFAVVIGTLLGNTCLAAPRTAYEILEVERTADFAKIKSQYRKLAMKWHPDRGGDETKFKELNEAYQQIGSEDARSEYDALIGISSKTTNSSRSSGTISDEDVRAFKRKIETAMADAYATSNGDSLQVFFKMFYLDNQRYIDATTRLYLATGKRQIADQRVEELYRRIFHDMASHIWFIGSSTALQLFERDFAGENLTTGIARHMMSMYDRLEETKATAMFTLNISDTEKYVKEAAGDLIDVIFPVCRLNTPVCVKELAFQMDDRAPKIYKVLNEKDSDYLVDLIDNALSSIQVPAFSSDYFRLLRIRNDIAALNHNFVIRTYSCASLMTTRAVKEIKIRGAVKRATR